jgi:carboxyl-terminal processing protease
MDPSMDTEHNNRTHIAEGVQRKRGSALGVVLALGLAVAAFFSGSQFQALANGQEQVANIFSFFAHDGESLTTDTKRPTEAQMEEFWRVWELLDDRFIAASSTNVVSTEDKLYGAIAGLVRAYDDPYTVFLPPVESEAFAEDISGNFSGVGMEVGNKDGVITVIAPLPDTPAEQAGIMSGDLILRIDDVSTEGMSIDEAVRLIRGEKGTMVTLSVFREGAIEIRDYEVVRDTITVPTVKTRQEGDVFIINLYSFNALSESKMREAVLAYQKSSATNMVIDLRGNPGGYLQSAVSIAGLFLPTGKVVVRERHGEELDEKIYRSQGAALGERAPKKVVVLVDGGSASASEILAGALSEHGYATVIGVNTFGKGSVQELIETDNGSSLKVTVARWFTPNGRSISDGGLTPDIFINRTAEQRLNDEDPQLTAALDFLAGKEVVSEAQP